MPSSYQPCSFYCFFLCTEKFLELEIPILCLLCFVVCLWRIVGTLAKRTLAPIPWGLLRATASLHGCFCCFCLDRERNGKSRFEIPRAFVASSTGYESVAWTLAKHKYLLISGFLGRRELTEFPQHFQGDCVPWQRTGLCSDNQQLLWVPEILFSRGAGVQYISEVTRETHVKGGLAKSTLTRS